MSGSRFKRPPGIDGLKDDPEEQYRAGFQHGADALLELVKREGIDAIDELRLWVERDLGIWRHDETSKPAPPEFKRSG